VPALWVRPEDVDAGRLCLRGEEAHHLLVRRHRPGDEIDVIDGCGTYYRARLDHMEDDCAHCTVHFEEINRGECAVGLHLGASLIKGQRMDFLMEKATEIGVASVTPVLTRRGVVRPGSANKLERWERLARAAAKQCGRSRVPEVRVPEAFGQTLTALANRCDLVLMAEIASDAGTDLRVCLDGRAPDQIGLLIGPEGGFAPEEIERAQAAGVLLFTWGARVLRADTAAVVLSALVLDEASRRGAHPHGGLASPVTH